LRLASVPLALVSLLSLAVEQIRAQEPKPDSATFARANKPIIRWGEILGVAATTGIALALDQTIRDRIHDPHDALGRTLSDIGNGFGDGVVVYSTLLGLSVGGKVLGKRGVYGVSSRALKSTVVAGAAAMVLKSMIGRERPSTSPDSPYAFNPFRFKDQSLPSGHAAVAFALATSFAREIEGQWDDAAFFTLATLTAYARMHDDKHWASDVVFGAGVGILASRFVHRREAKIAVGRGMVSASFTY
jgi:acid phosphatase family membrane protein YuiD